MLIKAINQKKIEKSKKGKMTKKKKETIVCPIFVTKTYFEYDKNFHILEMRVFSQ